MSEQCCGNKKISLTKGEFLWEKYNNFIIKVKELPDAPDFMKKFIDGYAPKEVNELMALIKTFLVPFHQPKEDTIDFDAMEKKLVINLTEEQSINFEELKKNTVLVDLCKKYAVGLTQIFLLI